MNVDVFSGCVFTRGAFECLGHQLNMDVGIAVFDVGLYVDNYHKLIYDERYSFVIVLNARRHPPIFVSRRIVLISKSTPLNTIMKIIKLFLFKQCELSQITLTSRECLYYKYWLEGRATAEIAIIMRENIKTVSNIKQSIYRKYDASDLYTFMLIMKISQMNGNVDCRHYKLVDGVEIKNNFFRSVKNVQFNDDVNATIHVDFYSSA
ncbi:LuxR C-terminal-related transcriptional regulator [Pectobacterium aroidearum]|uniref:LuxR C-terminal-related transcriptional regulator n=1 Tax=Pectobacterium aroidearum TaxID=1201031 RepID=UPI0015DFBB36|nr:LuxR C-terminal-related transcriptional regulator [Pectobacterium aroidearum]MBA0206268.1 hypothetical protein [Pectobacterium aroidearum]